MAALPPPPGTRLGSAAVCAAGLLALFAGCARKVEVPVVPAGAKAAEEWAALIRRAASDEGVDYDLIGRERATLDRYLSLVGQSGPEMEEMKEAWEERRIAFAVNAYNAAAVHGVLADRPRHSVLEARVGLLRWQGAGFFHGRLYRADGEWMSLYYIEHQLAMGRYEEPLVWAALHRPARGSPRLRWWKEKRLQRELERAMGAFLDSDRGLRPEGDGWAASELFYWYEDEFLDWGHAATLCDYQARFASGDRAAWLKAHATDCPLGRLRFDWTLDAAPAPDPPQPAGPVRTGTARPRSGPPTPRTPGAGPTP